MAHPVAVTTPRARKTTTPRDSRCRGALLNAEGRARNIDALSLFMGNTARAHRYASEELREWWETHPRVTFAMFERQWADQRAWEMAG
ncbi:hypothetical protein [uncultured Microbacterium sp.]|uniref:hypothetical protein n=1 Tax=uncultured Microbacterium sp. TaxID=191216 RepID=UPI0026888382